MSDKKYMREQAICVFELTKGFTTEPTNGGKAMLEMAGYVMELTNEPQPQQKEQFSMEDACKFAETIALSSWWYHTEEKLWFNNNNHIKTTYQLLDEYLKAKTKPI